MVVEFSCCRCHRLVAVTALVALAGLFAGRDAFAQEQLHLRDGAVFQGELVEKIPGDHVTIKLATGETRRVEWSDLVIPDGPGPRQPPAVVHVWVTSDRDQTALLRVSGIGRFGRGFFEMLEPVCVAPCEVDADANALYQIGGPGVRPSRSFPLPRGESTVGLQVAAGSTAATVGGIILLSIGTVALTMGSVVAILGATARSDGTGAETAGGITLGAGAALMAAGIVVIANNATDVRTDRGRELARAKTGAGVSWLPNGFAF